MGSNFNAGIESRRSNHSVDQTVDKFKELLALKGVKLFAVIDHSGEAEKVGLHMPPTKLLIFGNPKAGTPIMISSPSAALDLPLKVLVSQDAAGNVSISYNGTSYLQARHAIPKDLLANIALVADLVEAAAQ